MITDYDKLLEAIAGEDPEKPVTNQQRQDWNNYVDWLDKRKLKGHPSLDKNNLGNNMLAKYIKETPGTSLTLDSVIPIQNEFTKYRQWSLGNIKQGKSAFGEGVTEENYLRDLTRVDGIPGQRTTTYQFPKEYLETFADKKLVSKEEKGFATIPEEEKKTPVAGLLEKGNINLFDQPSVPNPETGGESTVWSTSFGTDKGEVLVSRVTPDGKILSKQEALDYYKKTGKHMGIFKTPEDANAYADQIHKSYEAGAYKNKK